MTIVLPHRRFMLASKRKDVDPSALALFSAMTVKPDATRQTAIETLIKGLKACNYWQTTDVLQIYAAHSEQSALLNWKNPAVFQAANVNSMAFTADRGFQGDGFTSYLTTGFTPSTGAVQGVLNNAQFEIWNNTDGALTSSDVGSATSAGASLSARSNTTVGTIRIQGSAINTTIGAISVKGRVGAGRVDSANQKYYKSGVPVASTATASSAQALQQILIGRNVSAYGSRQIGMFRWGSCDEAALAAAQTAFAEYMTAIGNV